MPTALLSVYHKEGIVEFARELVVLGWNLIASRGTCKLLREANLSVRDVADLVGGGPILGHRVVTLSREVHAGLLATTLDQEEMASLGLEYIELVCVDLYPLKETIKDPTKSFADVLEKTDIGGPTMLRSGAKGNRIVICDPADRQRVIDWLKAGKPHEFQFVNDLAAKAEIIIADYCLTSGRYRSNGKFDGLIGRLHQQCCYGENHYQSPAALFTCETSDPLALDKFTLLQGNAPSYINWTDIDRLLRTITHIAAVFDTQRDNQKSSLLMAVGCKHGNPCGAAVGHETEDTIKRMTLGDPLALFGGIVMTNFPITGPAAEIMLTADSKRVLDGVAAPEFTPEAVKILHRRNDRCRLYENHALANLSRESLNQTPIYRPVRGGFLRQPNYKFIFQPDDLQVTHSAAVSIGDEVNLQLAWAIGSTSNSNTITLVKNAALIGNGVGQQDRVGGCKLAIERARRSGHDTEGAVAYSDSFFPFPDGPKELADAGIKVILTSSGSQNDKLTQQLCQERGITLYMIPDSVGRGFFGH